MLIKIKEYKTGLRVYYCSKCKHIVRIPKYKKLWCWYCGNTGGQK